MINFFVFGSFFFNKEGGLCSVERLVSHAGCVTSIHGLHGSEEARSIFSSSKELNLEVFVGDLVGSNSSLPF
jgi:hypothetical protein